MIKEINHIGIKTYDMDASIRFYTELLGGEIIRDAASVDGKSRYVYVQIASGVVELITSHDPADQGYAHIAYLLADESLDAHHAKLTALGLTFTLAPKLSSSGNGRLAFFNDPAGVSFELIERKEDIRRPFAGKGYITAMDYAMIETPADPAACAAVYRQALGLHETLAGSRFTLGSDCIALSCGDSPRIAHLAMRAFDPAALRQRLEAQGVPIQCAEGAEAAYIVMAPGGERVFIL